MSTEVSGSSTYVFAQRVWAQRFVAEHEAAARFRALVSELRAAGATPTVVGMAEQAAADELRHADLCRRLVDHFGGDRLAAPALSVRALAPREVEGRGRLRYEIVALSCVTETLSTALLGELVAHATDPVCKSAMRSILRDEVSHSRLGWAFLADEHARGAQDCVGTHLPALLDDTLGAGFFAVGTAEATALPELAGLGSLVRHERQRIVRETLEQVVFPGLARFGVDTARGWSWLRAGSTSARLESEGADRYLT